MQIDENLINKARTIISSKEFSKLILNFPLNENNNPTHDKNFKLHIDEDIHFDESLCREFILFTLEYLGIKNPAGLQVVFSSDKEKFDTFAFYSIGTHLAAVYCVGRHILDCFRSIAHELVHYKQDINNEIPNEQVSDKNDGEAIENEANAIAGVILRIFGRKHPELY